MSLQYYINKSVLLHFIKLRVFSKIKLLHPEQDALNLSGSQWANPSKCGSKIMYNSNFLFIQPSSTQVNM